MASTIFIPITEYLATTYRPDREYVDGHLLDRSLGEIGHSWLQGEILLHLARYRDELGLFAVPEQRV